MSLAVFFALYIKVNIYFQVKAIMKLAEAQQATTQSSPASSYTAAFNNPLSTDFELPITKEVAPLAYYTQTLTMDSSIVVVFSANDIGPPPLLSFALSHLDAVNQ